MRCRWGDGRRTQEKGVNRRSRLAGETLGEGPADEANTGQVWGKQSRTNEGDAGQVREGAHKHRRRKHKETRKPKPGNIIALKTEYTKSPKTDEVQK